MSVDNSAAQTRLEQVFDTVISGSSPGRAPANLRGRRVLPWSSDHTRGASLEVRRRKSLGHRRRPEPEWGPPRFEFRGGTTILGGVRRHRPMLQWLSRRWFRRTTRWLPICRRRRKLGRFSRDLQTLRQNPLESRGHPWQTQVAKTLCFEHNLSNHSPGSEHLRNILSRPWV